MIIWNSWKFVNSISRLNQVDMRYEMGVFLRLEWKDERLDFRPVFYSKVDGHDPWTTGRQFTLYRKKLWKPLAAIWTFQRLIILHSTQLLSISYGFLIYGSCIRRANENIMLSEIINCSGSLRMDEYLYGWAQIRSKIICFALIWANKAQRFTLEMDCHMDFHLFPFDYQLCPVELESYGHTTSDIIFKWIGERSILYAGSGSKEGFALEGYRYNVIVSMVCFSTI